MIGCGKTSLLCKIIKKYDYLIDSGRTTCKRIFVNFPVSNYKHTVYFDFNDIGKMDFSDCYIVIERSFAS